ncbi:MAG: hypothetical protein WCK57_08905 [Verrucomicrobiae bacterium]
MEKSKILILVAAFSGTALLANAAVFTVENQSLVVRYDDAAGTFSVVEKISGAVFVKSGKLDLTNANAKVEGVRDNEFGRGQGIVLVQPDGSTASLELYPDLPFVLVRGLRHNQSQEIIDLSKVIPATFTLDLGRPASELCTLGTAGLTKPGKNPGSYLFLTCADPETRRGVVAGWLTEDRGSGVLFSSVKDGAVDFKARIDYGHLHIPTGTTAKLETLAIGIFDDARIGEELYADAIKRQYHITLRPRTAAYCSWYAEQHGEAGDEKSTVALAKFAAKELKPFGLGVVQIDDEWQDSIHFNGPRRGFDRVRPDGPYAHGIAPVAAEVEKSGLTFGLWWLPFARNFQDPEYTNRQDWFVKRTNGKPYDTEWGGTCLDLTHPEVQAQLARIARLYRSWGVTYYKMDGLWTGAACEQVYVNDGYKEDHFGNNLPFHNPLKSNIEAYRDGLKLIRKNAGDDVFFSGCCVAQNMRELGAIGLVDSMRIGPDANGNLRSGPLRGTKLYFLNGRVWWNDPDPCIVRAVGTGIGGKAVTLDQARLTASWVAIAGQFFLVSDWLPALPPERLDILKRTMLSHNATTRPVDYFDNALPTTWLVTASNNLVRRDVIGVFNFETNGIKMNYSCTKLGLDPAKKYYAFDFWANSPAPMIQDGFNCEVSPMSCRILAVRGVENHPVLVSTSRHVTQGIVDVTGEKWDTAKKTLSGVSQIIGNDPYELRVAGLNADGKKWKLISAMASAKNQATGVAVTSKPAVAGENGWRRVGLDSKTSRVVRWTLEFANE